MAGTPVKPNSKVAISIKSVLLIILAIVQIGVLITAVALMYRNPQKYPVVHNRVSSTPIATLFGKPKVQIIGDEWGLDPQIDWVGERFVVKNHLGVILKMEGEEQVESYTLLSPEQDTVEIPVKFTSSSAFFYFCNELRDNRVKGCIPNDYNVIKEEDVEVTDTIRIQNVYRIDDNDALQLVQSNYVHVL